ncbi:MAG: hypothetical protein QM636_20600, partial [Rhizobium sp.]
CMQVKCAACPSSSPIFWKASSAAFLGKVDIPRKVEHDTRRFAAKSGLLACNPITTWATQTSGSGSYPI